MRLANERDQEIIRSAIADSSASTLSFLSSMGQREAIAFGEGVATTMRMKFERLDPRLIPGSVEKSGLARYNPDADGEIDLADVVSRISNMPRQPQLPDDSGLVDPRVFGGDTILKRPLHERLMEEEPREIYGRRAYDTNPFLRRR